MWFADYSAGLFTGRYINVDNDFIRHDHAAAANSVVGTVDLERAFKVAVSRVLGVRKRHGYAACYVFDREVEHTHIPVAAAMLKGDRFHFDLWVFVRIEVTVAFQVVVARTVIGIDGIGLHRCFDAAAGQVSRIEPDVSFKTGESAVDRQAKVFDMENDG